MFRVLSVHVGPRFCRTYYEGGETIIESKQIQDRRGPGVTEHVGVTPNSYDTIVHLYSKLQSMFLYSGVVKWTHRPLRHFYYNRVKRLPLWFSNHCPGSTTRIHCKATSKW